MIIDAKMEEMSQTTTNTESQKYKILLIGKGTYTECLLFLEAIKNLRLYKKSYNKAFNLTKAEGQG